MLPYPPQSHIHRKHTYRFAWKTLPNAPHCYSKKSGDQPAAATDPANCRLDEAAARAVSRCADEIRPAARRPIGARRYAHASNRRLLVGGADLNGGRRKRRRSSRVDYNSKYAKASSCAESGTLIWAASNVAAHLSLGTCTKLQPIEIGRMSNC